MISSQLGRNEPVKSQRARDLGAGSGHEEFAKDRVLIWHDEIFPCEGTPINKSDPFVTSVRGIRRSRWISR